MSSYQLPGICLRSLYASLQLNLQKKKKSWKEYMYFSILGFYFTKLCFSYRSRFVCLFCRQKPMLQCHKIFSINGPLKGGYSKIERMHFLLKCSYFCLMHAVGLHSLGGPHDPGRNIQAHCSFIKG